MSETSDKPPPKQSVITRLTKLLLAQSLIDLDRNVFRAINVFKNGDMPRRLLIVGITQPFLA